MKDFDYIIIGGGCAGLSLAYELEINKKLIDKTLAVIDTRANYSRDKTWSFWRVIPHNFEDCVIKSWDNFTIKILEKINSIECSNTPYQSIDSGLFYKKILNKLRKNKNITFSKNVDNINTDNSIIFNSLTNLDLNNNNLWQHFSGVEIETSSNCFDEKIMNLMDFNCDQKKSVHFFYTLPYSKNRALIESTWLSDMKDTFETNYEFQIKDYIENNLNIQNYKVIYKEQGKIPLFYPSILEKNNHIYIGTAGCMTRLSTGYTFLNIQEHSKFIVENIESISTIKKFEIKRKYKFLDKVFLKVLRKYPEKMPKIFYNMFLVNKNAVIKFLSNKSSFIEDLLVILKMPKWIFIKELFSK